MAPRIPTLLIGIVGDSVSEVNLRGLLSFPDPVNETSARLVAAGVVAQAIVFLVVREWWVLVPLTYGFLARVATGPTLSPLGQFVTRIATPAVERQLHRRRPGFESRQVPGSAEALRAGDRARLHGVGIARVGARCTRASRWC